MSGTLTLLNEWIDESFWAQGAFITSSDGEHVTLAKGGKQLILETINSSAIPVFYLKDFYQDHFLAYIPNQYLEVSKGNFLHWLDQKTDRHEHISPISNEDDLYHKDFIQLKNYISENLKKVVLVSRETYEAFEGKKTILRLIKKSFTFGPGLPYGIWGQNSGMIGCTPEILFKMKKNELHTFALAGTSVAGQEQELINSRKDRKEHKLVVQDIQEKLKSFSSELRISETKVEPFKNLIHLKTDITAELQPEIDLNKLILSLSPTAALGGYPKATSLEFLKSTHYFQKYPQRYFGSAFGIISSEKKEFLVAIRNIQWEMSQLFIESGGGIVAESNFEKELEEIHLKRDVIRSHYL